MKSFLITIVVTAVLGTFYVAAIDDLYVPGIRSLSRAKRMVNPCNSSEQCCQSFYGPKCLDCRTLLTCADAVINQQSCSSINSATPYCVNDACSDKAPQDCDISKKLRCTSQGVFSDPDNCEKYFYCVWNGSGFASIAFDCPSTYVYDSPTGLCKKRVSSNDCKVISCTNNLNKYQLAAFDKSLLAYCADTLKYKETLLFRCIDPVNMEWDMNTLQCNFVCKAEGRYADVVDCHRYYDCFKNGTTFSFTRSSCPNGFKFDANTKMCAFGIC